MSSFKIYNDANKIKINNKSVYISTGKEVDRKGDEVTADYRGRKYSLIIITAPISLIERIARSFFGVLLCAATLPCMGLLFDKYIWRFFNKSYRTSKAGVLIKSISDIINEERLQTRNQVSEIDKAEATNTSFLENLPPEIMGLIVNKLTTEEILNIDQTSKKCSSHLINCDIWNEFIKKENLNLRWSFAENYSNPAKINYLFNIELFKYFNAKMNYTESLSYIYHSPLYQIPQFKLFIKSKYNIAIINENWKKSLDPRWTGDFLLNVFFCKGYSNESNERAYNNLKILIDRGVTIASLYAFMLPLKKEQFLELCKQACSKNDFRGMEFFKKRYNE